MADAQSKAQIHTIFADTLQGLLTQARDAAAATMVQTQTRPWQVPKEPPDVFDIGGMNAAFDRAKIADNHAEVIGDVEAPGTAGDVISLKLQSDYVAAVERAFRARHATAVRCMAHAAGRRDGHGHAAGIFSDASGALRFATDVKMIGDMQQA